MLTTTEALESLKQAAAFFAQQPQAASPDAESFSSKSGHSSSSSSSSSYKSMSDSDGLLNFLLIDAEVDDALQPQLDAVKQDLIDLVGIGTQYVLNLAASKKDNSVKYDPDTWNNVFNHFPLMGPTKCEQESYSNKVKGVEISAEFLKLILDSVTSSGAIVKDFADFIKKQGDTIRLGYHHNGNGFKFAAITATIEVVAVGSDTTLVPKIKAYFLKFDKSDDKWTSSCASYNKVDIDFKYEKAASIFNAGALADADVRQQFDAFVESNQMANIQQASNFFSGQTK